MLESLLRHGVLPLGIVLALAPVVGATLPVGETLGDVESQASDLHPAVGWALDQLPSDGGDGDDGSDGGSSQGSQSGSGSGGSGSATGGALAPARPLATIVLHKADGLVDSLDPMGLVGTSLQPVNDAANGLPAIIAPFATAEPEVSEPAPASAAAEAVEPDVSVPILIAGTVAMAGTAITVLWLAGSSGSLGAGAAGGSASKLAGSDLRRLLPFASPLFTRFEKDTVLGHPKREALYALILQDPGVSLQSLCDSTGLSRTAVTHHLRLMELQHLIVSKRMGRSRHYYENGGRFGRDQKDAYAVLQNDRSKAVADFVKQNPGAIQKAICGALAVQASVAHWHLKRLQDAQLVEAVRHGRTVSYFPGPGLKALGSGVRADAPVAVSEAPPMPALATPLPLSV